MSLLDDASLLVTPNAEKATKLYSIIPSNGNGDFSVTRATTATRTNSSGLIESVPINEPRLDYSLGSCPNILLEPQRTNLFTFSEQFDNAAWNKTSSSVTTNSTISPSGLVNADTFTGDGLLSNHRLIQSISVTAGITYTLTCYVKKGTNDFFQMYFLSGQFGATAFANYDLNNGVLGTVGATATATITNVGNGWYRCSITSTATATGAGSGINLSLISSATSARAENNTLATSLFVWGAQLEAGAYATSYIPTTSASVTRNADVISRGNIFTNGLITASGGTWFVDLRNNVQLIADNSSLGIWLGTSNATNASNGTLYLRQGGASQRVQIWKYTGGAGTSLYQTTSNNPKLAIKWNGTTADVFENGVKVVTATAFAHSNMEFLNNNTGRTTNINSMALFPTPLTDTQCIALTT